MHFFPPKGCIRFSFIRSINPTLMNNSLFKMISGNNVTVGIFDKRINRYTWSPSVLLIFPKCTLKDIIDLIRLKKAGCWIIVQNTQLRISRPWDMLCVACCGLPGKFLFIIENSTPFGMKSSVACVNSSFLPPLPL